MHRVHRVPTEIYLTPPTPPSKLPAPQLRLQTSILHNTTTAPKMTTPAPFPFPREYSFPPFFTRQTNLTTHHAQLVKWSDLILAYCRHNRIFKLSLNAAIPSAPTAALPHALPTTSTPSIAITDPTLGGTSTASSGAAGPEELFHNKTLNKRLSLADAREVLEFMKKDGRAEQLPASPDVFWVYWRTPDEWAAAIEAWIDETAQKGVVLTLYELTEGEGTRGTDFHGLDSDLLQKALQVLVKRGKAQIFGQEDSQGVKFF